MLFQPTQVRNRTLIVVSAIAVVMGIGIAAAEAQGAEVIHYDEVQCSVGWADDHPSVADDCSETNTKTPNGGYTLVLHGQIPDGDLSEFSGPTSYPTGCAVNYFFWRDGIDTEFVHTTSVRHFTADGGMTEVCTYRP
jgi:hypothetical protein